MLKQLSKLLRETGHLTVAVKVIPKSQTNQITETAETIDGKISLRVKIRGVPEKGQVNQELITFLAKQLDLAKSNLEIISGHSSRHKIIHIHL